MASKKISMAVIKRLPRYHRYLSDLLELGIKRVSSKELSIRMGITASQIRQDLNCFGGFGQQGYGYNVESLFSEIGNILGINKTFYAIIIGAGNMGQALANYGNFEKRGFKIIGIFDANPSVIGSVIQNIEVMNIDDLDGFVVKNPVDIAIMCVPYRVTASLADRVGKLGIKGLWNFSPMDLKIPYDVIVENVHLSDSLMVLGYTLNERYERE
jgi:redox-sensing transcriptional repressor